MHFLKLFGRGDHLELREDSRLTHNFSLDTLSRSVYVPTVPGAPAVLLSDISLALLLGAGSSDDPESLVLLICSSAIGLVIVLIIPGSDRDLPPRVDRLLLLS